MTLVRRYWGYGLLAVLVFLIINRQWDPTVVLVVAGAAAIYFFFQVPVWCGADTRDGKACRNNSRGLLFGCNQFRQHKMQVLKAAVIPRSVRDLRCAYWASPNQRLASIGAVTAVFATLVSLAGVIVNRG